MFSGLSLSEGSISTVLMPRQMPEKEHVLESYCFVWHIVMSLKIEHEHLQVLSEPNLPQHRI